MCWTNTLKTVRHYWEKVKTQICLCLCLTLNQLLEKSINTLYMPELVYTILLINALTTILSMAFKDMLEFWRSAEDSLHVCISAHFPAAAERSPVRCSFPPSCTGRNQAGRSLEPSHMEGRPSDHTLPRDTALSREASSDPEGSTIRERAWTLPAPSSLECWKFISLWISCVLPNNRPFVPEDGAIWIKQVPHGVR